MATKNCTCLDCQYVGKPKSGSGGGEAFLALICLIIIPPIGALWLFALLFRSRKLKCAKCGSERVVELAKKKSHIVPFIFFD